MNPIDLFRFFVSARSAAVLATVMVAAACGGSGSSASRSSPSGTAAPPTTSNSTSSSSAAAGSAASAAGTNGVVSWVHIGDLHIQTADMQNYKDLQTILGEVNQDFVPGVSFAVLPGDNANEGSDAEYQLIGHGSGQGRAASQKAQGLTCS